MNLLFALPQWLCPEQGCEKSFFTQTGMRSHVAQAHIDEDNGGGPYACAHPHCGKSFKEMRHLKSHTAIHTVGVGEKVDHFKAFSKYFSYIFHVI